MTREETVRNLLTELIDMIDNGSQRDLDRADEIGTSIIKLVEQDPVIDKIRAEIVQVEINGHIRDVECFRAGIDVALNIINKYDAESEE